MNNNEIKISTLNEFLNKISELGNKVIVYRGQSNKEWGVESSAYRRLKNPDIKKPDIEQLLDYNVELLEKAKRYADEFTKFSTDIELLTKLRHYGAATSLIDFTKSALVALWFACQDEKTNGKVFCLDIMSASNSFLEVSIEEAKKDIKKILTLKFRDNNSDKTSSGTSDEIAKWDPPITDNRILKQDSFFIFNKSGKLESNRFTHEFSILKESKKQILKELKQLANLSEETISPDFYGFAQNNSDKKPYGQQSSEAYIKQGFDKAALGNYEEAIKDYDKAIELNPQSVYAYYARGYAYSNLGNYKEAIKDYNQSIVLNPKSAYAYVYYARGYAKAALGNYEEAIKDYDKAIELNPKSAYAYYARGYAHSNCTPKRNKEAVADYTKAIELNPQFFIAYYDRGLANFALDEKTEAINDFTQAIKFNPQFASAYHLRGHVKAFLGHNKEAIDDWREAKRLFEQVGNMEMVKLCEDKIQDLKELLEK